MDKYICLVCGYVYDPKENNNIAFEDLPDDWRCPVCSVGKDQFTKAQSIKNCPRKIRYRCCRTKAAGGNCDIGLGITEDFWQ